MNANLRLLLVGSLSAVAIAACSDDSETNTADTGADIGSGSDAGTDATEGEDVVVSADITADTTWTANNRYFLQSLVFVRGATLTIEAGTTVYGANGSALVIARDAQIDAQGTADAPIVFTSDKLEDQRAPGDWGGVVLLGSAPTNIGEGNIEGMEASDASAYGGTDAAHSCGTLRYVRIEYAGFVFGTDNELNGLTVGGCGTGTTLSHIQIHKGTDDGLEFFGGTASADHIVISGAQDDSVDWDEGFAGRIQFLVVQQDPAGADSGFEADNLEDDNNVTPRSNPTIYNATLIGGTGNADTKGMVLRRGTAGFLGNSIVMGFGKTCVDIRDTATVEQLEAGELGFNHVLFFDCGDDGMSYFSTGDDNDCLCEAGTEGCADPGCFAEETYFTAENVPGLLTGTDPQLGAPYDLAAPNFVPAAGSPAAAGNSTIAAGFDTTATYYGAFAPGGTDWTAGWTSYP